MQFKAGQDRVVVVLPYLGIAVKFSVIHFWLAVRRMYCESKSGEWKILKGVPGGGKNIKTLLFQGLTANWSEFRFYWQTRNPLLQPTYLSLGFVNVQRYGEPCKLQGVDFFHQLCELLGDDFYCDFHCFDNPNNFCFYNGKLRILDYGSHMSREIIARQGAKIVELFNPAYCWEEEKKKLKARREH